MDVLDDELSLELLLELDPEESVENVWRDEQLLTSVILSIVEWE